MQARRCSAAATRLPEDALEERLGGRNFLILYFVSGIGGALLSFATPNVPIIGASGAIMGVMVGSIVNSTPSSAASALTAG